MSWEPGDPPPRVLPPLDPSSCQFWTGGRAGNLFVALCIACWRCAFPPSLACPDCGAATAAVRASGKGSVFTYTVCHQQFHPAVPTPYVVALIELDDFPGSRVPANIVGGDPAAVRTGMRVAVRFEEHGDVFVPVFVPADRIGA